MFLQHLTPLPILSIFLLSIILLSPGWSSLPCLLFSSSSSSSFFFFCLFLNVHILSVIFSLLDICPHLVVSRHSFLSTEKCICLSADSSEILSARHLSPLDCSYLTGWNMSRCESHHSHWDLFILLLRFLLLMNKAINSPQINKRWNHECSLMTWWEL